MAAYNHSNLPNRSNRSLKKRASTNRPITKSSARTLKGKHKTNIAAENLQQRYDDLLARNKKIEQALLEMEQRNDSTNVRMMQVMADKNNFLSVAAHDLKSPLNSMLGLLNVLKADSVHMTGDQQENIALIFAAGKNMKSMIERLQELTRIEQRKSAIQKAPVDLVAVIQAGVAEISAAAERKNIQLSFVPGVDRIQVITDPAIFLTIFQNLASNAIKFLPSGRKVMVNSKMEGNNAVLEVEDNGPGIRPEEVSKVFGKFQKLSARPTGGETSTGLGLSIVKELVAILDGKVSFTSVPGVSTIFRVELPMDR